MVMYDGQEERTYRALAIRLVMQKGARSRLTHSAHLTQLPVQPPPEVTTTQSNVRWHLLVVRFAESDLICQPC